jgi:hypothetical protein
MLNPGRCPWFVLLCAGLSLGCTLSQGTSAIYVVPASLDELSEEHFFDHPWPSDLRLEQGAPRLLGYPNPRKIPLIDQYLTAMNGQLDGFSPAAAGFVRFTGPLDESSLPSDPLASIEPSSSVQLIDIDPASPEHGQRKLITVKWRSQQGVYFQPNTLAFMPALGFPLRPKNRYAFVVTDAVRDALGEPVSASADLRQALGLDPAASAAIEQAKAALAPDLAEIQAAGISKDRIVHLGVFHTSDPVGEMFALRDEVLANVPAPSVNEGTWSVKAKTFLYNEYEGIYGPSPNYQKGTIPFEVYGDGGGFEFVNGKPQLVDTFDLRFSLTVPKEQFCPMPASGYPIVLYAHGTGGSYRSYVNDGTATALAKQCVASMGVDQIFHGTRPGAPPDGDDTKISLLFFNFQNVVAARTNTRQAAIDEVQRARLFTETKITVPASVSTTGFQIRFDKSKVIFFGHSQGGLNGPLFLAADKSVLGGVLSGSSAVMAITLLEKTKPSPSVAALVQGIFLGLKGEEAEELSELHPAISLAQSLVDPVDPLNYARHAILEPRDGFTPKSVYMTEGVNPDGVGDSYSPPHGIEMHALAMGLPLQMPSQRAIEESRWGGPTPVTVPPEGLSGNLNGGAASGVLAQWPVPDHSDGHFVVFDVPEARLQAAGFCRNLAEDPKGKVPAP